LSFAAEQIAMRMAVGDGRVRNDAHTILDERFGDERTTVHE